MTILRAEMPRSRSPFPRDRMHGGPSTGPRTPEGLARSRRANWKHGAYSREAIKLGAESRRQERELLAHIASANALGLWLPVRKAWAKAEENAASVELDQDQLMDFRFAISRHIELEIEGSTRSLSVLAKLKELGVF